jgi:hypothetical protein
MSNVKEVLGECSTCSRILYVLICLINLCWVKTLSLVDLGGSKVLGDARTSEKVGTNKPITSNKRHPPFAIKVVIN